MTRLFVRVYVATRYADAAHVESVVKPALNAAGLLVCSTWHLPPHAPEDLAAMSDEAAILVYETNRADLESADAVLLLDAPGARETFAEAEQAYAMGLPLVWLGRPHLSARARQARGSWRVVKTLEEAIAALSLAAPEVPRG